MVHDLATSHAKPQNTSNPALPRITNKTQRAKPDLAQHHKDDGYILAADTIPVRRVLGQRIHGKYFGYGVEQMLLMASDYGMLYREYPFPP